MKTITSRTNQEISKVAHLKEAREREKQQRFTAEGVRICKTLIDNGIQLDTLYTTEPLLEQAQKITSDENIVLVSQSVMEKISSHKTPSGVLGVFKIPKTPQPETLTSGLVLAHITDPGNMGTLMRTAVAVGVRSVVIVEGVDPFHPKVIQASAGTIGAIQIFRWTWQELLKHKQNKALYALTVSNGQPIDAIDSHNALLVIGNEAHGIPENWLIDCENNITIPMPGGTESLNAAVAGSIALYLTFAKLNTLVILHGQI